ncbi:hypothetical protein FGO68_gene2184 [Halteria grandinella]|uniref:Dynein axonemal assembly factor 11-like CS domain-containing protein n=1 Tax=Halteria grandinella TaxID=5974 RepID=A0A8J8NQJ2_HALGN|nr:hypothetical protein FGO68_gene2184 [Halteria grandinella]
MPFITQELLRKRAEHNECMLSTLEEVSLHQQDIEKIENLDVYCRHLKILYLQSNLIPKMEGLSKLKELEYINLAVNNISKIEGIRNCESLMKIDLTLNFMDVEDLEESIDNVMECEELQELYLTGNPCCSWEGYKEYIVGRVSQLKRLDGEEITRSQRLEARQRVKMWSEKLKIAAAENIQKKAQQDPSEMENAYTKESRVQQYQDMQDQKARDEKRQKENSMFSDFKEFDEKNKRKEPPSIYNPQGEIRQCNEGKYEWLFGESEDKTSVTLDVFLPKFMDTSLVTVDLNPLYVRMDIKGKITQLRFDEEIIVEKSKIQRSTTTGVLKLTMPRSNLSELVQSQMRLEKMREEKAKDEKLAKLTRAQEEAKKQLAEPLQKGVGAGEIQVTDKEFLIKEHQEIEKGTKKLDFIPDFDVDEVPPLE